MNYDLFDTATVTLDDVELWLKAVPRFTDETAPNRLLSYAVDYDVVNKIRTAKVNKSFYQLQVIDKQNLSRSIKPLIKPKYKPCTFHPLR